MEGGALQTAYMPDPVGSIGDGNDISGHDNAKRGRMDEENEVSGKRTRMEVEGLAGRQSVLKLLLPNNQTGSIIGKQGAVLKQITEESGARVKISATDEVMAGTGERVATLVGSLASLLRAQQLISNQLASTKPGEESSTPDAERTIRMLVPNQAAGLIIGKAGVVIKELMERSGASIRVSQPSEMIAQTQERIVMINGTPASIDLAQNAICELLAEALPEQQPKQIDYSILKQGGSPHGLPALGTRPRQAPLGGGYPSQPTYYSQLGALHAAPQSRGPPMAQDHTRNSAFAMSVPAAPLASQSLQSLQPRPAAMGESISSQMLLPDKMISGIIGKGGSIIREIAARSGAQVRVSQKETINAAGERLITMESPPALDSTRLDSTGLDGTRLDSIRY